MVYVFASYARSAADESQARFIEDLRTRVVGAFECRPEEAVFFDKQTIQLGQIWEREIEHALNTCKCFVALLSPGYLASDNCGREWGAFHKRLETIDDSAPPLILPVIWQPVKLPVSIKRLQHSNESLGELYARNGLRYVMHFDAEEYQRFLGAFCRHLHEIVLLHGIADAAPPITLATAPNPFRSPRRPGNQRESHGVGIAAVAVLAGSSSLAILGWHVHSENAAAERARIVASAERVTQNLARTRATSWLEETAKYSHDDPSFALPLQEDVVHDISDDDLFELIRKWTKDAPGAVRFLMDEAAKRNRDPRRVALLDGIWCLETNHAERALARFDEAIKLGAGPEAFHGRARAHLLLGDERGWRVDMSAACGLGDPTACKAL
jgi:hypothetical protein